MYIKQGKTCSKCGEFKEAAEFHVDSQKTSGLTARCKTCRGVQGNPKRVAPPTVFSDVWLKALMYDQTCVICESSENLGLYLDGTLIQDAETVDQAKSLARRGDVFCHTCKDSAPKTLKQRLRQKNRRAQIEETLNTTDTIADLMMKARTNQTVADLMEQDALDSSYIQTVAVEKIFKRNNRTAEKQEAYPILTDDKKRTIYAKEKRYGLWQDLN